MRPLFSVLSPSPWWQPFSLIGCTLREELITEKLEEAPSAAKNGDFDQAGKLIDEAEKLGAERERCRRTAVRSFSTATSS